VPHQILKPGYGPVAESYETVNKPIKIQTWIHSETVHFRRILGVPGRRGGQRYFFCFHWTCLCCWRSTLKKRSQISKERE